jgi:ribosomal protein S12 methylthiotransferase
MPDQVPEEIKEERWRRLMERQSRVVRKKHLSLVGSSQDVLVIGPNDQGQQQGRTRAQAPDIDGVVLLTRVQADAGEIVPVQITGVAGYDLRASFIDPKEQKKTRPVDSAPLPL